MPRTTDDLERTTGAPTRNPINSLPSALRRPAALLHLDFAPRDRPPSSARLLLATIAAIAGSLAADALIVAIGVALFPATKGYVHFQFSDYGKLTVIGVLIACAAWPITTRITSQPRRLFYRMAILVTIVLLLPDFYILYLGQPATAVSILMVMHLAIAVVTYSLLINLAPTRQP